LAVAPPSRKKNNTRTAPKTPVFSGRGFKPKQNKYGLTHIHKIQTES
jgi:hypothetical protein